MSDLNDTMEQELQELGLNKHEAKIYLAGLQAGAFSAGQVATQTKINHLLQAPYIMLFGIILKPFFIC